MWGEREPDFRLLLVVNSYHLGCFWKKKNLLLILCCCFTCFQPTWRIQEKKNYSEEAVLKLELKDLKLDLKLDGWGLVLKFITFWAEAGAKVKWGGWGQVLFRRFACTNKSLSQVAVRISFVQERPWWWELCRQGCGQSWFFFFWVSHEVIKVNVSLNLGLTEWSGDVWAQSGVSCAAGLFTLVSCSGELYRAGWGWFIPSQQGEVLSCAQQSW